MPEELPSFKTQEEAEDWIAAEAEDSGVDNIRFAYLDDVDAMLEYEELKSSGCCGFLDRDVIVAGRRAQVGCNYGH